MEADHRSVSSEEPPASKAPSLEEPAVAPNELAQLAGLLRRAVASIDAEARERLEAAWVAFTSAVKQPHQDASRVAARLARLRSEIDRIMSGQLPSGSGGGDDPAAGSDR